MRVNPAGNLEVVGDTVGKLTDPSPLPILIAVGAPCKPIALACKKGIELYCPSMDWFSVRTHSVGRSYMS